MLTALLLMSSTLSLNSGSQLQYPNVRLINDNEFSARFVDAADGGGGRSLDKPSLLLPIVLLSSSVGSLVLGLVFFAIATTGIEVVLGLLFLSASVVLGIIGTISLITRLKGPSEPESVPVRPEERYSPPPPPPPPPTDGPPGPPPPPPPPLSSWAPSTMTTIALF